MKEKRAKYREKKKEKLRKRDWENEGSCVEMKEEESWRKKRMKKVQKVYILRASKKIRM